MKKINLPFVVPQALPAAGVETLELSLKAASNKAEDRSIGGSNRKLLTFYGIIDSYKWRVSLVFHAGV